MNQEYIEVNKMEHHHWRTCPCDLCKRERERVCQMSPEAAHRLGIISSRCPAGSLARQLASPAR